MNQREPKDLFEALAELRQCYPDWRLGQLVANVAGWTDQNVWDVEDEQFLAAVKEHLRSLAERSHEAHV
jgi:hypothetical protein